MSWLFRVHGPTEQDAKQKLIEDVAMLSLVYFTSEEVITQ